jgi:hypothetical protein
MDNKEPEGKKFDGGKLRYDLLPVKPIEDVTKVITFGANKYGDNNWKQLNNARERYYAACARHIAEYRKGNQIDDESGLPHLAHAMCNIIFIMELMDNEDNQKGND